MVKIITNTIYLNITLIRLKLPIDTIYKLLSLNNNLHLHLVFMDVLLKNRKEKRETVYIKIDKHVNYDLQTILGSLML